MTQASWELTSGGVEMAARRTVAAALASALRDPAQGDAVGAWNIPGELIEGAWEVLASTHGGLARSGLGLHELGPERTRADRLVSWLGRPLGVRRSAYRSVFGLVFSKECPPYETEYCESRDTFHRAQQMADLGGFYRAFGLRVDPSSPERPDHVSLVVGFVSSMAQRLVMADGAINRTDQDEEHLSVVRDALRAFVRDHVAWWLPTFGRALEARATRQAGEVEEGPLRGALIDLAGIGRLVRAWATFERAAACVEPSRRILTPSVPEPENEEEACQASCGDCASAEDNGLGSPGA